jgi:hypothetical protein
MIESDQLLGLDKNYPRARQRPRCGARLRGERKGLFCQRRVVQHRTTCPNHCGCCTLGLSKGATTEAGRQRIAEAQRARWKRYHDNRAAGIAWTGKPLGRPRKGTPRRMEFDLDRWVRDPAG